MMRGTTRGTAVWLAVIVVIAVGTSLLVSWKMRSATNELRSSLSAEIARGSLVGLGRAQAIGRRVILADPDNPESAALLAFASALLATEFGQGAFITEAESAAARVADDKPGPVGAIAGAARALVALRKGELPAALARATAAAEAERGVPHARFALGRVRAASGDLVGASRALEAAMVEAPEFMPARVAWAEVRIDLGDAKGAAAVLAPLVAKAPEDVRARLLLEEAQQALGQATDASLESACGENGVLSPYVVAGCALAWSARARIAGERGPASAQASAAARATPDEPRMLARAAQLLAQAGAVDKAQTLFDRAAKYAKPEAPALAWARLAVTLGHGRAATAPPGLRPTDAMQRVLAARAAFAAGGGRALGATLDGYGGAAVARDADLRLLQRLVGPAPEPPATISAAPGAAPTPAAVAVPVKPSPAVAYAEGMRAVLDGQVLLAAEKLSHALSGHGDACRAAGEYIAALRAVNRHADETAFTSLRAENAACVNLPAQ
jgi:tetratricopeptide (TPR) repeat protein